MAIQKDQLYAAFEEHKKKISEIKEQKYIYKVGRPCKQFGKISQMGIKQITGAMALVKKEIGNQDVSLEELGVSMKDLGLKEENKNTFLGYSLEEWMEDFKTRAKQLKDFETLQRELKAVRIMKDNFSDDDKFAHEMARIESILNGDGDTDADINVSPGHIDEFGVVEQDEEVVDVNGNYEDYCDEDDEYDDD